VPAGATRTGVESEAATRSLLAVLAASGARMSRVHATTRFTPAPHWWWLCLRHGFELFFARCLGWVSIVILLSTNGNLQGTRFFFFKKKHALFF